jgi:hypothetical protein
MLAAGLCWISAPVCSVFRFEEQPPLVIMLTMILQLGWCHRHYFARLYHQPRVISRINYGRN